MTSSNSRVRLTLAGVALAVAVVALAQARAGAPVSVVVPSFQVDPSWPRPLPNDWLVGHVTGVAVDSKDNVYLLHRARFQQGAENTPELIVFDPAGNVIHSWGSSVKKADGTWAPGKDEWGPNTHGVYVDGKDNVWVTFGGLLGWTSVGNFNADDYKNSADNAHVLKFDRTGKLLLAIGKFGKGLEGSNNTQYLGQPTDVVVDPQANEVYIADGYTNKRVIVFDADTGAYKRHWGAFGKTPIDPGPYVPPTDPRAKNVTPGYDPKQQFNVPHCVTFTKDRLLYVCDRGNRRIHVFKADGTFVKEKLFEKGSPWDIDVSRDPKQRLLYVVDGNPPAVHIMLRETLEIVDTFGRRGRWAGQFESPDNLALDSKGNLYIAETLDGRRLQKFVPRGTKTVRQ